MLQTPERNTGKSWRKTESSAYSGAGGEEGKTLCRVWDLCSLVQNKKEKLLEKEHAQIIKVQVLSRAM